ncbi:hypothetical protein CEP53_007587 [Fusarium sp. AF-6]|nr:hypothetical protein CEP53_007587 [Fusarium sp. AF-6]
MSFLTSYMGHDAIELVSFLYSRYTLTKAGGNIVAELVIGAPKLTLRSRLLTSLPLMMSIGARCPSGGMRMLVTLLASSGSFPKGSVS